MLGWRQGSEGEGNRKGGTCRVNRRTAVMGGRGGYRIGGTAQEQGGWRWGQAEGENMGPLVGDGQEYGTNCRSQGGRTDTDPFWDI